MKPEKRERGKAPSKYMSYWPSLRPIISEHEYYMMVTGDRCNVARCISSLLRHRQYSSTTIYLWETLLNEAIKNALSIAPSRLGIVGECKCTYPSFYRV